jgi:hypothetical protein
LWVWMWVGWGGGVVVREGAVVYRVLKYSGCCPLRAE